MRYLYCVLGGLISHKGISMVGSKNNLIENFRQWKFRYPPNYAELPIDENAEYNVLAAVNDAVFSKIPTEPLSGKISLVCASDDALQDILDLDPQVAETDDFINFIAGSYMPDGAFIVAHRYGGHQFGFWADQLGDGRAHILGEYMNRQGESWQPQLKGCGETPYSRFGDGRAVLRSSVREMLAAEACWALQVPTTRAAALVVSDSHTVWRDQMYSGRAKQEPAAVVLRLARAWYRLGSLEILARRSEPHTMIKLLDFVIKHHFPKIDSGSEDPYVQLFEEVARLNLDMVAAWQGVGFTHGVLNTDNVSLLGDTLDYGPYGFMDHYYGGYVPNSSDDAGRYAFDKQPQIMVWNLVKFADALKLVLTEEQNSKIKHIISTLEQYVTDKILRTYLLKLGLVEKIDGDDKLVQRLLEMMEETSADFTATFRQLTDISLEQIQDSIPESAWSLSKLKMASSWKTWFQDYQQRLQKENVSSELRVRRMLSVNPLYIPRNWMLQEAIRDASKGDYNKVRILMRVFSRPYSACAEGEEGGYSAPPPAWSYGLKLSCSS